MSISCVLLDVEGTTSAISFVYDRMFPYVRASLGQFVEERFDSAGDDEGRFDEAVRQLGVDVDKGPDWLVEVEAKAAKQQIVDAVTKLMDDDVKATGLKQLQGMIWKSGFESGELVSHLFDDVEPAIRAWVDEGVQVRIYSSGSIQAQKLFFGHSECGDLLPLIAGHYDTTIGSKKEANSYVAIAEDVGVSPDEILFVSDVPAELDAAKSAGMKTVLSLRPGNHPVKNLSGYQTASSFAEIDLTDFS